MSDTIKAETNINNHVTKFSNLVVKYDDFRQQCYRNTNPKSIEDLHVYVMMLKSSSRNMLCRLHYDMFNYIYRVNLRFAEITISESFMVKLKKWLQGKKDLIEATKNQSLIFIINLYSYESVVFNTVRAKRPVASVVEGDTLNYINRLVENSAKTCNFCLYTNNTPSDVFGRMESTYSVITSSTFKIDTYHSLALLKTHNPLYFSQLQFIDCINLALKWFDRAHDKTPSHLYRIMYWDILPKAGASQIHPHIQLSLGDYTYNTRWNQLHKAGMKFSKEHNGQNYWTTLLQIHTLLGLSVR